MTRTDQNVAVSDEDQTASPSGYRARIGDTEVLFASEAEFRKAERAMQALRERAARIPKIPSHYTDGKTPEAKALAERLNRKRTVSLVLRRGFYQLEDKLAESETVHLSETGRSFSEARLKLADYEKHSIELLPLILLLSHFGFDIQSSSFSRQEGVIVLSADDPRDQEELTAVFRQVKAGALSFDFQTLRNVHDFTLTVRHARRIRTSAVMAVVQQLQSVFAASLLDCSIEDDD